ncbi:MAG TPA: glycosyltransferase family 2 protein [Pseudobacteroides sp.]|uniref:glycosyltransferase family 2 protein n=1 Tax=Pseudobacteroides sp. TaxID=1968840 RepID=UPI002F9410BC
MSKPIRYSVIVPLFNEEAVVLDTYKRIKSSMDSLKEAYEIVFINDGSRDRTSDIVHNVCRYDKSVKLIELSRNFGQQLAVTAGIDHCEGDAIVVIDADLQDPPEVIPKMIAKWKDGYDVVYGKRIRREWESLFKRFATFTFYRLLKKMTDIDMPTDVGDFRLIDRRVCDLLKTMKEKNRYFRGLVSWLGFKTTSVEYYRDARFAGKTHYSPWKLIKLGLDAIMSFSFKPLKFVYYLGVLIFVYNFISLVFLKSNHSEQGIFLTINFMMSGMGVIALGILGEYTGRIYDEVKHRPLYAVKSTANIDKVDKEVENVSQKK